MSEATLEDTLHGVLATLLSMVELRKGREAQPAIALTTAVRIRERFRAFTCSLLSHPAPPILHRAGKLGVGTINTDLLQSDGRSCNANCDWDRVILATLLTYKDFDAEDKLQEEWSGDDVQCSDVLNALISNYIVVSGWESTEEFLRTGFGTFLEYYNGFTNLSERGRITCPGYFSHFTGQQKTKFDVQCFEHKKTSGPPGPRADVPAPLPPTVIFGPPGYKVKPNNSKEGDVSFVLPMRRALLFFYFLLKCPAGSLIEAGSPAFGSQVVVDTVEEDTKEHLFFKQIYQAKDKLSSAQLIAELAAQACDNFLLDDKRLGVVRLASEQYARWDQNPDRAETKERDRESSGALAPASAGCNMSALAVCPDNCALSLFTASSDKNIPRHYAAEYLLKRLRPGPLFELCVFNPHLQAALFASRSPVTAPSAMFKAVYTPPDVAKEVGQLYNSCTATESAWNDSHPFSRMQDGAGAYSALCAAHPTIVTSASYVDFVAAHPTVASSLLTTAELFSAYRAGLLACYAVPALKGGLQEALSLAASVVAPSMAGAAVHAVLNQCQYWLPLPDRDSLVAAAKLAGDRCLLLVSDGNSQLSVRNVPTSEYNSLAKGWTQWYTQRLLFDLSCWAKYDGSDSDLIQADTQKIAGASQNQQTIKLSSLGRTAFARLSSA